MLELQRNGERMQILKLVRTGVKFVGLCSAGAAGFTPVALFVNIVPSMAANTSSPLPSASASASSSTLEAEPAIGAVSIIRDWKSIALPVDRYASSDASRNLVLTAEYDVTRACMARFGIDFTAPSWTNSEKSDSDHYRLFGLMDFSAATRYGYHSSEEVEADGQVGSAHESLNLGGTSPATYMTVFTGDPQGSSVNGQAVPDGGCVGEARSKLHDDLSTQTLTEDATNYGLQMADKDSRVVRAFSTWSKCMSQAGFNYPTPMAANDDPRWGTTTASQDEISAATADVNCKLSTNLTGLRVAAAAAYQTKFITSRAKAFSNLAANKEAQLQAAQSLSRNTTASNG